MHIPPNILNLSSYGVISVEESDRHYRISAQVKNDHPACLRCHSDNVRKFGHHRQRIKDLPIHGKQVELYVLTQRYQCQACNKTFYEPLPDVDSKRQMTERLVERIGNRAISKTFSEIADDTGLSEGTVRNIFRDYINKLEKTVRTEIPQWLGIDEIHLIKPRCVISNVENNTIVDILKNRNKATVIDYLRRLEGHERIQYAVMDMWRPYRDAIETVLPNATIIIDKFHVVRMANDALERVRKSLRRQLTDKERRTLKNDRFILLKREHKLSDREKLLLDGWRLNYPALGLAYRQKEAFYHIYEAKTPEQAQAQYKEWRQALTPDIKDAFSNLTRAWDNWEPYICNYFDHPITNAYTESLNNLIRVMNRLGRGYSFEALRAKILFAEGAFKTERNKKRFRQRSTQLKPPRISQIHEPEPLTQYDKYYGVDIDTLTELLKEGLLS